MSPEYASGVYSIHCIQASKLFAGTLASHSPTESQRKSYFDDLFVAGVLVDLHQDGGLEDGQDRVCGKINMEVGHLNFFKGESSL